MPTRIRRGVRLRMPGLALGKPAFGRTIPRGRAGTDAVEQEQVNVV